MEASGGPEARPDLDRGEGVQPVEKLLMLVGVFHFPTDYGIDVGELARELERASLIRCSCVNTPTFRSAGAPPSQVAANCPSATRTRTTPSLG